MFESIFTVWSEEYGNEVWEVVDGASSLGDEPNTNKKKVALKLLCKNKYTEDDLIHICIRSDFTAGWCFTKDSLCFYNTGSSGIIKYRDITDIMSNYSNLTIFTSMISYDLRFDFAANYYSYNDYAGCMADYLNTAKMLSE